VAGGGIPVRIELGLEGDQYLRLALRAMQHTELVATPLVATLRAAGCVFAEDEATLLVAEATDPAHLALMVDRRVGGLPLEHVLGWAEFRGLRIEVDEGVFVPRPRSELLVDQVLARAKPGDVVVDLCCGTGAIGVAVAAGIPIELHAVDLDPAAVACARRNVEPLGGRVYQGDLYEPLPTGLRADIIVAVAPYVPTGEIDLLPREARLYEPAIALDGGDDGLDVVRRMIAEAPRWLAPGGSLLLETSELQATLLGDAITAAGLAPSVVRVDELDETVVIATAAVRR
jgi:release factor glutamine methyltransferase